MLISIHIIDDLTCTKGTTGSRGFFEVRVFDSTILNIDNIAPYIIHKSTETKCNIIFAYLFKGSEEDVLVRNLIPPRVDETLQCSIPNAVCMF